MTSELFSPYQPYCSGYLNLLVGKPIFFFGNNEARLLVVSTISVLFAILKAASIKVSYIVWISIHDFNFGVFPIPACIYGMRCNIVLARHLMED